MATCDESQDFMWPVPLSVLSSTRDNRAQCSVYMPSEFP